MKPITYRCTLKLQDVHHNLCKKTKMFVNFYSAFTLLLEFMMTSSVTEKSLHESFQTANKFFGAPSKYQPLTYFVYHQF